MGVKQNVCIEIGQFYSLNRKNTMDPYLLYFWIF